jgi:hypothetical protein
MESDSHAALLAETSGANLLGLAKHDSPFGNENVLMVVRVNRIRDQNFDWADGIAVKPVHQHSVQSHSLIDHVRLANSGINIDLNAAFDGSLPGGGRRRIARRA